MKGGMPAIEFGYLAANQPIMESSRSPVFYTPGNAETFFRRRHTVTCSFVAGILLFFLPFAEYRCTSYTLASNSGWGIATGAEWKSVMLKDLQNSMEAFSKREDKKEMMKELGDGPNIFAIAALAAGVIGLVIGLLQLKSRSLLTMSAGILAVLMLIGFLVQLKWELQNQLSAKGKGDDQLGMGAASALITLRFTLWYYFSVAAFAAAAFFGYKHHRIELEDAIRTAHEFEFQQKPDSAITG